MALRCADQGLAELEKKVGDDGDDGDEDGIKDTAGTKAIAKCSGRWRSLLPVCHQRHPWNWPWRTKVCRN